jgi:signal transduction histidine kinase
VRPTSLCPWSQRELEQLGLGSAVCVPLALAGTCLGAVLLVRTTAGAYDRADVEMAIEVSRQLAILVDNARQYHHACEQVRDLEQALAVAAHELRTPTSAMSGYAQLQARQLRGAAAPPAPSDIQYGLERIERQAQRVAALIRRLLDAAQLRAGSELRMDEQEVDLQQLVCDFSLLARASVPNRRLLVQAPEPITATVDVVRIEQVLSNLVDNACKFSPPHTSVELSLCLARPNVARIAVRDHGPGVAVEHRGRIFDAYYQAQGGARAGGLGLGLYLSRTIVELHGGRLLAEYPADGGSRFIVELPARRTTTPSVVAATPRQPALA